MPGATAERIGVPDDDGDNYTRVGISEAEMHANYGEYTDTAEIYASLGKKALAEPAEQRAKEITPRYIPSRYERQVRQAEAKTLGGLSLLQRRNIR